MTTQLDTNNDSSLSRNLGKAKDRKEVNVYIENKYEPIIDTLKELSLISFSHAKNKITHQFYIPSYFNDYVKVFVCASAQGSVVGILSIDIDDAGPKYKGSCMIRNRRSSFVNLKAMHSIYSMALFELLYGKCPFKFNYFECRVHTQ